MKLTLLLKDDTQRSGEYSYREAATRIKKAEETGELRAWTLTGEAGEFAREESNA